MTCLAIPALPVKTVSDFVAVSIVSIRSIALPIESLNTPNAFETIAIEAMEVAKSSIDLLEFIAGSFTPDLI